MDKIVRRTEPEKQEEVSHVQSECQISQLLETHGIASVTGPRLTKHDISPAISSSTGLLVAVCSTA